MSTFTNNLKCVFKIIFVFFVLCSLFSWQHELVLNSVKRSRKKWRTTQTMEKKTKLDATKKSFYFPFSNLLLLSKEPLLRFLFSVKCMPFQFSKSTNMLSRSVTSVMFLDNLTRFRTTKFYITRNTRQVSSLIHSARPIVAPVANIVFCSFVSSRFEKWGRTDGRTTCAKTFIPTGRDFGLAEWIN